MKTIKFILTTVFVSLSLFTWLRDTTWFTSLEDVVPLFISFTFFMYLAKPWETSDVVHQVTSWPLIIGVLFLFTAFILDSTLLFTCCTCCVAWLWFDIFSPHQKKHQLIVFLFLAFPWIALSAEQLGWFFRMSGATFAYKFFALLGFPAQQQGTSLIVSGVFLSVDSACAGMSTLQAVLIMGFAIIYLSQRQKMNVALNVFLLTVLAWWTNAMRIVVIGFAALTYGEEFALGLFHTWGSMILLIFMFSLTFAMAHLQKKYAKLYSEKMVISLAFIYITINITPLFSGWWRSPLEKYGWLILSVWLAPCALHLYNTKDFRSNSWLLSLAILSTFLGYIGELNTLCYLGFAGFVYSFFAKINIGNFLWVISAVVWMPAFSWFASYYISSYIFMTKLIVVTVTSAIAIRSGQHNTKLEPKLPQLIPIYIILFILALIWPFLPHQKHERLRQIPHKGFGFVSQDIPLTAKEQGSFGKASVLKRFYKVGKQTFVLLAIDGTNDRHAVHDPNYCIVGAGWKIIFTSEIDHHSGKMRFVKLQRGSEIKEVVYWFCGELFTYTSPTRYWYETTMRRISLGHLYKEPLLVILQTVDNQSLNWNKVFDLMPQIREL